MFVLCKQTARISRETSFSTRIHVMYKLRDNYSWHTNRYNKNTENIFTFEYINLNASTLWIYKLLSNGTPHILCCYVNLAMKNNKRMGENKFFLNNNPLFLNSYWVKWKKKKKKKWNQQLPKNIIVNNKDTHIWKQFEYIYITKLTTIKIAEQISRCNDRGIPFQRGFFG